MEPLFTSWTYSWGSLLTRSSSIFSSLCWHATLFFHMAGLPTVKTFGISSFLYIKGFQCCQFFSMGHRSNVPTCFQIFHKRASLSNRSEHRSTFLISIFKASCFKIIFCKVTSLIDFSIASFNFPINWEYSSSCPWIILTNEPSELVLSTFAYALQAVSLMKCSISRVILANCAITLAIVPVPVSIW